MKQLILLVIATIFMMSSTGFAVRGGEPPGLMDKDKFPSGLDRLDKTPHGWSMGKKRGWDTDHRRHHRHHHRHHNHKVVF